MPPRGTVAESVGGCRGAARRRAGPPFVRRARRRTNGAGEGTSRASGDRWGGAGAAPGGRRSGGECPSAPVGVVRGTLGEERGPAFLDRVGRHPHGDKLQPV